MDIEVLLAKNEGKDLDFKEKLEMSSEKKIKKDDFLKDLSAIANSVDTKGWLIYGIEDNTKNIVGISNPLKEEQIQEICVTHIDPPIDIEVRNIIHENKQIGVITITPTYKPHQVIKSSGNLEKSKIYVRRGSVNDEATPEEIHSLLKNRRSLNKSGSEKLYKILQHKKVFFMSIYKNIIDHEKGYFQSWLQEVHKNKDNINFKMLKFLIEKEYKYIVKKSDEEIFSNLFLKAQYESEYYTKDLLEEEKIISIYFKKCKNNYKTVQKKTSIYAKEVEKYLFENSKFKENNIKSVEDKLNDLNLEIDLIMNKIA